MRLARRIRALRRSLLFAGIALASACAPTQPLAQTRARLADHATGTCSVSYDGKVWYALRASDVAPIEYTQVRCARGAAVDAARAPSVPRWAIPRGPTRALFAATSFEEDYSMPGMREIAALAHASRIPVTWMVGDPRYLQFDEREFDRLHRRYGDDVEIANNTTIYYYSLPLKWFSREVSIDGAGRERTIASDLAQGARAFWGITWNSGGTDATSDRGAPWGAYCADPASYKRPAPNGDCRLIAFEWTARDLTRAYLGASGDSHVSSEAAYSTDPDDLIDRGGFTTARATAYVRGIVDAYAAAGESQPILTISQQEPIDQARENGRDAPVLRALYERVRRDGMRAVTLREATQLARTFAGAPRAIAFPFLDGGRTTTYDGAPFAPATIDYHDARVGMTFLAGHTLPSRAFEYADDPTSRFDRPLAEIDANDAGFPKLIAVAVRRGVLQVTLSSTRALRFGIAIWSEPRALGVGGPSIVRAGRAGFVIPFDLPQGRSTHEIACPRCTSTTFDYAR